MPKTIAIIAACGHGKRFAATNETPKQYQKLGGIEILRHSILAFLNHPKIDYVVCVINKNHLKLYEEAVFGLDLLNPVIGGETRQESVRNALLSIENLNPQIVLIHDAVRPFVSKAIVSDVIEKLSDFSAVIPVISVNDSPKRVVGNIVESSIERKNMWCAQTPQGFKYDEILAAHLNLQNNEFTDDAAIAESFGIQISVVPGSQNNFKITTIEDFQRAEGFLISSNSDQAIKLRIGSGFDVHAFVEFNEGENRAIRIGGVDISFERKLIAVSDGDVAIHALIDAILGALGEGDIGEHFPPSEKKWHGCDSCIMLEKVVSLLKFKNAKIVNIDLTVICEKPKISSHKSQIKKKLSSILNIDESLINIKATTTENLGFLGRKEGIACKASVLLSL